MQYQHAILRVRYSTCFAPYCRSRNTPARGLQESLCQPARGPHNNTVTALGGKQGLYGKVERFNKLSAKVSKTLPQLEAAHMDFESERLSLIVEPVEETSDTDEEIGQVADPAATESSSAL